MNSQPLRLVCVFALAALTWVRPLATETGDWPAYAATNASTTRNLYFRRSIEPLSPNLS